MILKVLHYDDRYTFHEVPKGQGWRIDNPSRCLVVGRGVPRAYIPLDNIRCFEIEADQ